MGFKDILNEDLNIFMDINEFSDIHNIDGVDMPVVMDDMEQVEREKKYKEEMSMGVYKSTILIYVKAADFGPVPAIDRGLKLDGKLYVVVDAKDEDGLYSITLRAHRS